MMTYDEATASRIGSMPQSVATTGSNARTAGDYATTVSMLNEILSLGSEDPPAPLQRTTATGPVGPPTSASSAPTGPRPVPEVALPPQPSGTPLAPDFFTASKPRRGLGRRRS
jgi:hypothetical protein